ncbi:hypothetical protein [Kitasatospora cineracea]|uniref:hypothetical protein n=1 Tax=Kitasatospora cineracea TaxID=88074 RepID=UPI0037F7F1B8
MKQNAPGAAPRPPDPARRTPTVHLLEDRYFELEAPVLAEVRARLAELVSAGRDVVLDHGLWLQRDREETVEPGSF